MTRNNVLQLDSLPKEELQKLHASMEVFKKEFPSFFMRPNVCQYRAFKEMYTFQEQTGNLPDMTSVEFANGDGKTHMMALDIIGWNCGPDFLQADEFPDEAVIFWNSLADKRDRGLLSQRIVCTADDMKPGGSVHEILKQIFPWCKFSGQDTNKCFRQIDIPHPTIEGIVNHVAVKTFDQPPDKHSGSTCDRIWVNENLPDSLWGETSARTRGGGNIAMFATILDQSMYLDELEDGEHFILVRCKGHLYENCIGEEVTDEMAEEVFQEIGFALEKNQNGKGYLTNGVLRKSKIDSMIEAWARGCPHEIQARKTGRPISQGGKIHPTYNREVHNLPNDSYDRIPDDWPMVQVVDPHPARPDACLWALILPSDRIVVVDEFPSYQEYGYFEKIKETRFTIQQKCEIWRNIEIARGYHKRIGDNRVGDPNRFLEPNSHNTGNLHSLYAAQGFNFFIGVNDDLEYGHELVNQALYYDPALRKQDSTDPAAQPGISFYDRCVNTCRAMSNYKRKTARDLTKPISELVDKKFACFASLVRYLVVWHQNHRFQEAKATDSHSTTMALIKASRLPKEKRGSEPGLIHPSLKVNIHGRELYKGRF